MKSKNIKEFKALILRYESITLKEIKEAEGDATKLTGFSIPHKCTLCLAATYPDSSRQNCDVCVWIRVHKYSCCPCLNHETYSWIKHASSSEDLLCSYRKRAEHMREVLTKLRIKQP